MARHDSEELEACLSEHHVAALKALLDALPLQACRQAWQLPPNNPFLRPPVKDERAGLIRGQTSAHRGLRTFAQDRSRGRRELSALSFSPALADDHDEGALYLRWRLDYPLPTALENALQPLRENARQAGVDLSFDAIGNDWRVKMVGLHQPMPAILDELARSLNPPEDDLRPGPAATPMIAIRQLLKALPACCAGVQPNTQTPSMPWTRARWEGMGIGLPAHCEAALKSAAACLPGQPDTLECEFASLSGQHLWHEINTDALDAALLLFCPTPTQSLADEAAWRLLAHLLQGPFYQRVRVELQIGYAVFSGVRQINGQTGLLFGVQSPSVSLEGIMEHLRTFLAQLPALIDASDNLGQPALAQQFTAQALPIAQAAELLWQARLAGHPSDYLALLQHEIQALTREDLQRAAQQLQDAAGGWHCIANGPRIGEGWQSAG